MQAIALYNFEAREENELSLSKNEIVEVISEDETWWTVKNKYGKSGLVPVDYIAAPVTEKNTKVVSRGKVTGGHEAKSDSEITIKEGSTVGILDKSDEFWWLVGFSGKTGYIPKNIISELKPKKEKEKKQDAGKFGFKYVAPAKALCDEASNVLFSFENQLPSEGHFNATFEGKETAKIVEVQRLNDFTLMVVTPKNFPAGKTGITVNHLQPGRPPQVIVKNVEFLFQSKINVVYKILSTENDPLKFLCSSFQVNDTRNVDQILSKNFEKKVPEGIDLVKCSKSVLVQSREMPTETPTLLHFAAYYNLQKLASALLRCPGSQEALAMKNSNGKIPVDVAKMRSNAETAELLEGHQTEKTEEDAEDAYMSMEKCYECYLEMGGNTPHYVDPDQPDEESFYEDMNNKSGPTVEMYDVPRGEADDRFVGLDEESDDLDDNRNRMSSEMTQQIEQYKVFGRMTEKEVQLALLMKRVKEKYVTQEQALEMAKVLGLEPQIPARPNKKSKPRVGKKPVAQRKVLPRKADSLPRTMSTSSGSSVSSVGSTGSSGYTSDGVCRNPKYPAVRPMCGVTPFNYFGAPDPRPKVLPKTPPVEPRKPAPATKPRNPVRRSPSDTAPPVPHREPRR